LQALAKILSTWDLLAGALAWPGSELLALYGAADDSRANYNNEMAARQSVHAQYLVSLACDAQSL
jgi:hypothetical protein